MNPRVIDVTARTGHKLYLVFKNGEEKIFDVTPYLKKEAFKSLEDSTLFATAHAQRGTVVWQNNVEFDPDVLYLQSKNVPK